ncbi:hypothetical protein FHE25_25040 [Salmonella enterica]|uniref:hypothetical protein n=1 Tax=Salmonella enterica TaxID=28901 RepID=UPI0009AC90E7|nr:hypothetical protein [Salmonella enterica]ECS6408777.1 hypothetical protein [Salmonella enterica subsp. enterica serovar Poona]EAM8050415.1 hypothetical protein [Salmonella enterica]EAM8210677.1 hypothetical protein [Salmonella enterica]EAO0042563.1 hypothetical protein [Salmonella enterica]EAR6586679.1 hypothetical protein [Salmonella enterica]
MTNSKNSRLMAFIKCHWRWCWVPVLLVLGFYNGYTALLAGCVSLAIIIVQYKSGGSEWYGTPLLLVLTVTSFLLIVKPVYDVLPFFSPNKHAALNDLFMTIQKDADRCYPATEEDRVQWLKIKDSSPMSCMRQITEEPREGVYRLQLLFWGVVSNTFSLASTVFPDPAYESECLALLDNYQRICLDIPGSAFDEQLKEFQKQYGSINAVHPGMIEQKTGDSQ